MVREKTLEGIPKEYYEGIEKINKRLIDVATAIRKALDKQKVKDAAVKKFGKDAATKKDPKFIKAKDELEAVKLELKNFREGEKRLKEEKVLKLADIKDLGKTLLGDEEMHAKITERKRKEKDSRIEEKKKELVDFLLSTDDPEHKPKDRFAADSEDLRFYNEHKAVILSGVKEKLDKEWEGKEGKNSELTPDLVKDFALTLVETPGMADLKKRYRVRYTEELEKKVKEYGKILVSDKLEEKTLSPEEETYLADTTELRDVYESALEAKRNGDFDKLDVVVEREKDGKPLNTEEKKLIAKYKDEYEKRTGVRVKDEKAKAVDLTKRLLAYDATLTPEEKELVEKYKAESIATIEAGKAAEKLVADTRLEIAEFLHKGGGELSDDHKFFLAKTGELEKVEAKMKELVEDYKKKAIAKEAADTKAEADRVEAESIAAREAFKSMTPEQKRAAALERYTKLISKKKKEIEDMYGAGTPAATAAFEALKNTGLAKREGANGSHARKMEVYNRNSEGLRKLLENKEYQKLSKMKASEMNYDQKKALEAFVADEAEFMASLEKAGASGKDFASLEKARAELAKKSQDFKHSFESKFFGSKLLAGVGNMFGFKWSGIKETKKTPAAQKEMHEAQERYDGIKKKLMGAFVGEEHAVRKAWEENPNQIAGGMENLLRSLKREMIDKEYKKLEELKHVLEDSVKKPAFEKFAIWYKNKYWNSIKNESTRRVVKRITNAFILGSVLLPFSAAAAGAVVGNRVLRAAISGTIGESAALGTAALLGGERNEKGEFKRFADDRDAQHQVSEDAFVSVVQDRIRGEQAPLNQAVMNMLKTNHEKAMFEMQKKETRVRKAEMAARALFGGGSAYALSQWGAEDIVMTNPSPTTVPPIYQEDVPAPDYVPRPPVSDGGGEIAPPDTIQQPTFEDPPVVRQPPEFMDGNTSFDNLKSAYDADIKSIDARIAFYHQVPVPMTEGEYYESLGYEWKGQQGIVPVKGRSDIVTEVYQSQGSVHYYGEGRESLARQQGVWRPLEESRIYKSYQNMHDRMEDDYIDAQNHIKELEHQRVARGIRYQNELRKEATIVSDDNLPDDNTQQRPSSKGGKVTGRPDGHVIENGVDITEKADVQMNKWVDDNFRVRRWLRRKDIPGMQSEAWQDLSDDNATQFLNAKLSVGDEYGNREEDFQDLLRSKARIYNMLPNNTETVEQFTKRLAMAEARVAKTR